MSSEFPFFDAPQSDRLERWRQAFADYIDFRITHYHKATAVITRSNWQKFMEQVKKLPWEITCEDVSAYIDNPTRQKRENTTINKLYTHLSTFYDWCLDNQVDEECTPDFNPVRNVPRRKVRNYSKATVLSTQEIQALLQAISSDSSILSLRDYAFTLTRLLIGVTNSQLLRIKWGNITFAEIKTWFTYWQRHETVKQEIPEAAWRAIARYLEESGRMEHIGKEDYIFAPLAYPSNTSMRGDAGDWNVNSFIDGRSFGLYLKKFARKARIPEKRVSLAALRNTAIMLFKGSGASMEELKSFVGGDSNKDLSKRLRHLERNLTTEVVSSLTQLVLETPGEALNRPHNKTLSLTRNSYSFSNIRGYIHGFSRITPIPADQLTEIIKENREDLSQEIQGLQILNDRFFDTYVEVKDRSLHLYLANIYTISLVRLEKMKRLQGSMHTAKGSSWLEDMRIIANQMVESGEIEAEALKNFPWGKGNEGTRQGQRDRKDLEGNIAKVRLMMRHAMDFSLNLEDPTDFAHLVDNFSSMGVKLAKLLAFKNCGMTGLEELREVAIEQAVQTMSG
jgi:site-specific recombinase XerD